jgi:hypothetical protein
VLCVPGIRCGDLRSKEPSAPLPVPFDRAPADLSLLGRTALWRGVQLLGPSAGRTILFPDYHCGAELAVLLKAGFRIAFYHVGADLRVDVDELERLGRGDVRGVFVIHYFGRAQPMADVRTLCAHRGWVLIEDCAQALFASGEGCPVGTSGDIAIFSLHKTLPLPRAGLLRVNDPTLGRPPDTRPPPFGLVLRAVLDVLGRDVVRSRVMRSVVSRRVLEAMSRLVLGRSMQVPNPTLPTASSIHDLSTAMEVAGAPWFTDWLIRKTCRPEVAERRRAHAGALLAALGPCRRVRALIAEVAPGDCPTLFPVVVSGERDAFIEFCWSRGVRATTLWSILHPALPVDAHPEAMRLRRETAVLPVHQDLDEEDVELLRRTICDWERGASAGT